MYIFLTQVILSEMFLLDLYIFIIIVFYIHFNYNLYIIHVNQSSDCRVFRF